MDSGDNTDLLETFKKLLAENRSFQSRLEEYARIIDSRNSEISMLHSMLSEANEYKSTLDAQVTELKEFKRNMADIQRQAANSTYLVTGQQQRVAEGVSMVTLFENLKQDYAYLQMQLTDLQTQLLEVNNRNMVLMLQTTRIAELESLLANPDGFNADAASHHHTPVA